MMDTAEAVLMADPTLLTTPIKTVEDKFQLIPAFLKVFSIALNSSRWAQHKVFWQLKTHRTAVLICPVSPHELHAPHHFIPAYLLSAQATRTSTSCRSDHVRTTYLHVADPRTIDPSRPTLVHHFCSALITSMPMLHLSCTTLTCPILCCRSMAR